MSEFDINRFPHDSCCRKYNCAKKPELVLECMLRAEGKAEWGGFIPYKGAGYSPQRRKFLLSMCSEGKTVGTWYRGDTVTGRFKSKPPIFPSLDEISKSFDASVKKALEIEGSFKFCTDSLANPVLTELDFSDMETRILALMPEEEEKDDLN